MFLDPAPTPGAALLAHLRRRRFLYLALLLHALPLAVLYGLGSRRIDAAAFQRRQQAFASDERLTADARLERRVHDMARIAALLDEAAGKGNAREADDVRFSARPEAPDALLARARTLAGSIDKLERDTEAERLAQRRGIPKAQALEQVAAARKPDPPPRPRTAAEAAQQIAQLEAKARAALERRRQQLAQQRQQQRSIRVAADDARSGPHSASREDRSAAGGGQGGAQGHPGRPGQPGDGSGPANRDNGRGRGASGVGVAGGAPDPSLLDRIAAFANPDLPDRTTQAYGAGGLVNFFGDGIGRIPDVDATKIVKGSGTVIGPGGPYANRVYVNRWYLIGPFEGRHGAGLFANYRHPPEDAVVLDAVYRGKGGRAVRWEYIDTASYPLIPPDPDEDAVYYGYTELMMDRDRDLTIWVGADDDARLWLNDRLVWRGGNVGKQSFFGQFYETQNTYVRDYNLSEGRRTVHFRQGRNKLFFKLANGPTRLFFSLVLTP